MGTRVARNLSGADWREWSNRMSWGAPSRVGARSSQVTVGGLRMLAGYVGLSLAAAVRYHGFTGGGPYAWSRRGPCRNRWTGDASASVANDEGVSGSRTQWAHWANLADPAIDRSPAFVAGGRRGKSVDGQHMTMSIDTKPEPRAAVEHPPARY